MRSHFLAIFSSSLRREDIQDYGFTYVDDFNMSGNRFSANAGWLLTDAHCVAANLQYQIVRFIDKILCITHFSTRNSFARSKTNNVLVEMAWGD